MFALRWGIAVAGIWWVIANMSLRDQVTILDDRKHPVRAVVVSPATEDSAAFEIYDPFTGERRTVSAAEVVNRAEQAGAALTLVTAEGPQPVQLLALDLDARDLTRIRRLLVTDPKTGEGMWVLPGQIEPRYRMQVPHPKLDVGLITLVRLADPSLLWAAVLVFPVVFVITSLRWNALLRALGIQLRQSRTFILNMVGAFYNTFMPGSTGGDLLKAYYASKQTPHRTQAVLSVLIDRLIGLMALVILGGGMASYAYLAGQTTSEAALEACRRVAVGSALLIGAILVGLGIMARPELRRPLGVDFILKRLPLQKHVQHAIEVMRVYRSRPLLVLWALVVTLPVHIIVVISAMLAGEAFGLPMPPLFYFVAVPVIVLSGAIPISPQGAGVMEFFAIQLTKQYGVTVSQAFALTMSIRAVQMFWNLTGGIFVFRGGYHAPSPSERQEMEEDTEVPASDAAPVAIEEPPAGMARAATERA